MYLLSLECMTFEAIDSVEFRETESHMVHEKKNACSLKAPTWMAPH